MTEDGPAELRIRFGGREQALNFVRLLREEHPTQVQPFGAGANAVVYEAEEDDSQIPGENVMMLVAGHADALSEGFLLGKPGEEPPPSLPKRRPGVPDQPFAPHGTSGGMRPDDGRTRGLNEAAPY